MSDHEDLPTFLLWVADSYEALANASTVPDEIDGFNGSAEMARRHHAALVSPPKAGEPVAWRWKAHGHEAGPWIVVHDKGTAEAAMSLFASKGKHQSVQPLYATQQPRVDGVRVTDEMVEAAARAWCLEWDIDPDLPHALKPGQPAWWTFEARGIRAALTAALSLEQGETAP